MNIDSSLVKLSNQLKALHYAPDSPTNDVVVTLTSGSAISGANFEITYFVPNAGWYSSYDARVDDIENPISLLLKATIFQTTGEDWKDVKLSISNGNPTENGIVPLLTPWYVRDKSFTENTGVKAFGSYNGGNIKGIVYDEHGPLPGANVFIKGTTRGTVTDFDGNFFLNASQGDVLVVSFIGKKEKQITISSSSIYNINLEDDIVVAREVVLEGYNNKKVKKNNVIVEKESIPIETTLSYQPTTVSYEIATPYTVLSDGKAYTAEIKTFELPAIYNYVSVPKLDKRAYLTARITNWQEFNLFDGEMNLFFEGAYLGKSMLDVMSASDTLNISLGKDHGISIDRKSLKEFKTKQFLSSSKTETRAYEIIVKNNKKEAIDITIYDQLPISNSSDITIFDEDYKEGTLNEQTKIITWKLKIPSKIERKLQLKYKVKSPKNSNLNLD